MSNNAVDISQLNRVLHELGKIAKSPIREEALMQGGLVYERQVKINITTWHLIDTGKMRASVAALIRGDNFVVVAVRTFYAIFHEYGTRFLPARPFLRPPMDTHRNEIGAAVARYFLEQIRRIAR